MSKRGGSRSYSNGSWSQDETNSSYKTIDLEGEDRGMNGGGVSSNGNHHGQFSNTNNNGGASHTNSIPKQRAIPGRPRKRMPTISPTIIKSVAKPKRKKTFCQRFYARWIKGFAVGKLGRLSSYSSVALAVASWYLLGVLSIGSSKLLLMESKDDKPVGSIPPLYLTLQQMTIGCWLFKCLLSIGAFGSRLQPWPSSSSVESSSSSSISRLNGSPNKRTNRSNSKFLSSFSWPPKSLDLFLSGVFFGLGFLATNYCFAGSSAAFVETVKAAEPITSATVAFMWGIETLGGSEIASLAAIVFGVLLSTTSNGTGETPHPTTATASPTSPFMFTLQSCMLVMVANLCFSFRGLYQKLFRATPNGSAQVVDDLNLQYRMQQICVMLLVVPVIILEAPGLLMRLWKTHTYGEGLFESGLFLQYLGLSLINGFAFASYNLASTYVLSRISVVHHAALNCIRRIFAIVVTSIAFGIPITLLSAFGMSISFCGFLCFTHYKLKRQRQPRPLSSLLPMSAV